jgi:hypothetical protein
MKDTCIWWNALYLDLETCMGMHKQLHQQLEDGVQLTIDELFEINLGTEDDPRPTFVSVSLTPEERENYREFLMEFRDYFT